MPVRVLIVDDSPLCREWIRGALKMEPGFEVAGEAEDGVGALELLETVKPDVITLDILMPRMDGLEAIREVMARRPTPILVVTDKPGAVNADKVYGALASGAMELFPKLLVGDGRVFRERLRALAKVGPSMGFPTGGAPPGSFSTASAASTVQATEPNPRPPPRSKNWVPRLVAVGASTGGPVAVAQVFKALPKDFGLPVIVVQHMDQDFNESYVEWLAKQLPQQVKLAAEGDRLRPGTVMIAPSGYELSIDDYGQVELFPPKLDALFVPSVDGLFKSVATAFGSRAVGVLLTGMGRDGAQGLKTMFERGALTIAQDRASCAVFGMPGAAVELGAVEQLLPLSSIAKALSELPTRPMIAAPPTEEGGAGASSGASRKPKRPKVLVVDDSPIIREAGKLVLEAAGFEVVTLESPLLVAGVVRREVPDIILLDVNMPALPGDVVAQIVKQHGFSKRTRVVLFSDLEKGELERRAAAAGASGFIQKSGTPDSLAADVRRFLAEE